MGWEGEAPYADRYGLSAKEEAWREEAARCARELLAPGAREADRTGALPRSVYRELGARGLIGAALPVSLGGGGGGPLVDCLIAEEVGAVDGSARGFLAVQGGLVLSALLAFGTTEQKERWVGPLLSGQAIGAFALTEKDAGSDVGAIATRLEERGGEICLQGEKIWITNGTLADVLLVFATEDPLARTKGLSCVLVEGETPGLLRTPMEGRPLGHRGSDHARIVLNEVRVPASARLGPPRQGFSVALRGLSSGRLHVAAGATGIQRTCLEQSVQFARRRRQFGQRIGEFQQVQAVLSDMHMHLEASRALVHQAARLRAKGLPDARAVATAKCYASEAAVAAALAAVQIHGARGYTDEHPVERHLRDAIALTIYEGTSNVQRLVLARALLGRDENKEEA